MSCSNVQFFQWKSKQMRESKEHNVLSSESQFPAKDSVKQKQNPQSNDLINRCRQSFIDFKYSSDNPTPPIDLDNDYPLGFYNTLQPHHLGYRHMRVVMEIPYGNQKLFDHTPDTIPDTKGLVSGTIIQTSFLVPKKKLRHSMPILANNTLDPNALEMNLNDYNSDQEDCDYDYDSASSYSDDEMDQTDSDPMMYNFGYSKFFYD